ncbi:Protein Y34B4A.7 [Aphelenchoides avenae]|nr:Protein Y34B4A.7 [Aphelenchus avenae]
MGIEVPNGIQQDEICGPDLCYRVIDEPVETEYGTIYVRRLTTKGFTTVAVTLSELNPVSGEPFTREAASKWDIKREVMIAPYLKTMAIAPIITGSIQPEQTGLNLLFIGLGGSSINNFYSIWPTQPKITVVELDATMKLISEKWFGLVETDTHKVLVGDGAEYLQTYPDTEPKFDAIFIDACHNDGTNEALVCPVGVFRTTEIAKHIRRVLKPRGTVTFNGVTMQGAYRNFNPLIDTYRPAFTNCYFLQSFYNQLLTCTSHDSSHLLADGALEKAMQEKVPPNLLTLLKEETYLREEY